jgi:hypothetical protein
MFHISTTDPHVYLKTWPIRPPSIPTASMYKNIPHYPPQNIGTNIKVDREYFIFQALITLRTSAVDTTLQKPP